MDAGVGWIQLFGALTSKKAKLELPKGLHFACNCSAYTCVESEASQMSSGGHFCLLYRYLRLEWSDSS